ncbi:hypothetical protein BC830DRAFT_1078671 [Chytriomyces sp. MP71]|nr:hypothetical protein BC830DRAFT_1078671 [Chytriomyces sp. MP71]
MASKELKPMRELSREGRDHIHAFTNARNQPKGRIYTESDYRPTSIPIPSRLYNDLEDTPLSKGNLYASVTLRKPTLVVSSRRALIPAAIALFFTFSSACLSVAALLIPDWFVINSQAIGYSANYGVFQASLNCGSASQSRAATPFPAGLGFGNTSVIGTTSASSNPSPSAPACVTGGYICTNAAFCMQLSTFQISSLSSIVMAGLALVSLKVLCAYLFLGRFDNAVSKTALYASFLFLLLAIAAETLSVVMFFLFESAAANSILVPGSSGLLIQGQLIPLQQSMNLSNSAFGGFGVSFILMAVAAGSALLGFAGSVVAAVAVYRLSRN